MPGDHQRLLHAGGRAPRRLGDAEALAKCVPKLAVLGQVDRGRAGTHHQLGRYYRRKFERCLAAQRHYYPGQVPGGGLDVQDVLHVFGSDRLEIEPVARVVVGRDGLGVAIDHDRLETGVVERKTRLHAAIVELDTLADPVGAGPKDHHLGLCRGQHLVGVLVGRVVIRGPGSELCSAGVDRLERRPHTEARPRAERTSASVVPHR